MTCHSVLERIAAGDLTARRGSREIEAHLAVCADCRARAASAEALGRQLRDPMMWEDPPIDMAERVVESVVGEGGVTPSRRPHWSVIGAAALVAVIVAFVWWSGRPDWSVSLIAGEDAPTAAEAVVSGWNRGEGTKMVFEVSGLDPAPAGHYYEVWLTARDGRHVSAGTFSDSGRFDVIAGVRRGDYPRIWVTLEPADDDLGPFPMTVLDTRPGDA